MGAKGGFVPKLLAGMIASGATREAVQTEGTAAYQLFISRCSISPTISTRRAVHPANVVRHDDDDPYLVVAADKGTASFSDIANAIADRHGFWLSDAFASGGSAGYDHKKMGITARGAWESVKRHFREIDVDIGRTPFTVAGVGDMSGDVFGNGMLQNAPSGWSQPSTIATSSSTLHPTRSAAIPSGGACSICRARAGRTTIAR